MYMNLKQYPSICPLTIESKNILIRKPLKPSNIRHRVNPQFLEDIITVLAFYSGCLQAAIFADSHIRVISRPRHLARISQIPVGQNIRHWDSWYSFYRRFSLLRLGRFYLPSCTAFLESIVRPQALFGLKFVCNKQTSLRQTVQVNSPSSEAPAIADPGPRMTTAKTWRRRRYCSNESNTSPVDGGCTGCRLNGL